MLERVNCPYCGASTSSVEGVCSTGCDLARRLPRGEEGLPVTWQLGVLLAWGFALFNQLLFAGISGISSFTERPDWGVIFDSASLVVGIVVFFALKPKKTLDGMALLVALAASAFVGSDWSGLEHSLTYALCLYNLLATMWLWRGLPRWEPSKKRQN